VAVEREAPADVPFRWPPGFESFLWVLFGMLLFYLVSVLWLRPRRGER
jgi:hypothetical protein